MKWINSFLTAFCAAGVCFGALFVICPDGKIGRSVKYLISLCFLVVIIALAGVNIKKSDVKVDFDFEQQINTEETQKLIAKQAFETALRNAGINFKEIIVFADILEGGGIKINKVVVYSDCPLSQIITAFGGEREDFEVEVRNE